MNTDVFSFNVAPARRGAAPLILFLATSLVLAASPRWAAAQPSPPPATPPGGEESLEDQALYSCRRAQGPVSVSFKPEVELKDLITWAMGFTCKNFIFGAGVGGRSQKVTIIAPKQMSPRQAWQTFLVALQTMGLTVVPSGQVLKIIEAPQSKGEALPLYRKGSPPGDAQIYRAIMRPEHISVDELANAFNALKTKEGQVTPLTQAGILVVTDYGEAIQRMKQLMDEVDRPLLGERLHMIKVQHADATELAAKVSEIVGAREPTSPAPAPTANRRTRRGRQPTPEPPVAPQADRQAEVETAVPSKIIADERTNSLIVLASEAAYLRVRSLVKRLDVALDIGGSGRIHVHYLENGSAEEMANTLQTVISGIQQAPAGQPQQPAGRRAPRPAPVTGDLGASAAFEGDVRVTFDKSTNALVVVASVQDYFALREVIDKLDIPRRQVFIEAVILEVQAGNNLNLGTSFHGGTDAGESIVIGGVQHGGDLSSLNLATLASQSGLIGGVIGPLLDNAEQLLGTSIPSFGVLFQALATSDNTNVLSSPHLLTTDNEEAELSVGENIPYQSTLAGFGFGGAGGQGGQGGAGGFGFPIGPSIQRQDVALTLKITPHVNDSDIVRLDIDQEISDIGQLDFAGLGPSWTKRTIKTTVVVRDQQSIVIGGLMSDRVNISESKVPLLGDIPLLGYLFKYTKRSKAKTNLLVLLTPYVIKDQLDIEQIVQRKVRERSEFVRTFSNFDRMNFRPQMDYGRKRGLLEEINRTIQIIEREETALREQSQRLDLFPDGPIEYEEDFDELDAEGAAEPAEDAALPPAEAAVPGGQVATPAPEDGVDGEVDDDAAEDEEE